MFQIDMNEWDKRLEDSSLDLNKGLSNKVIKSIIEVPIIEPIVKEEIFNLMDNIRSELSTLEYLVKKLK